MGWFSPSSRERKEYFLSTLQLLVKERAGGLQTCLIFAIAVPFYPCSLRCVNLDKGCDRDRQNKGYCGVVNDARLPKITSL